MRTHAALLALVLLAGPVTSDDKPAPPPLTAEQATRIRELVGTTQTRASRLQSLLEERQRELATLYAQYELNERQANQLQLEIVDIQRQMLANYHHMQAELRTIVSKERFELLRQRLGRVVQPGGPKEKLPER
ncbi:MAG: hypothetical protein K2R98_12425 [Gemmataceae bacterium]|nr:hypothetical protein [Gemmataceae bacterium]